MDGYRLTMGFSCNMPPDYPDNIAFQFNGKVNADQVMVAGYLFHPVQLQVVSIGSQLLRKRMNQGFEVAYKKISVQLLADPNTFFTEYANIGTMVLRKQTTSEGEKSYLTQLWTANYAQDFSEYKEGEIVYDSRDALAKQIHAGNIDSHSLQAVTEPMFLKKDGSDLSEIDPETGRQKAVYRTGCPFEIVPFAPLELPRYV